MSDFGDRGALIPAFFSLSDIEFGLFELRSRDFEASAVGADNLNGLFRFVNEAPVGFRSAVWTHRVR